MPKLFLRALHTEAPGPELGPATRDRLKASFPPGSMRRMTQLGSLVGHCLCQLPADGSEALVYASRFGEGRALEDFLASFPAASPTGFQTSIHPSGAQQGLIVRKRPIPSFFPLPGCPHLPGQALLTALLCPEPAVLLCGGEERGTWLTEAGAASAQSFAFACLLTPADTDAAQDPDPAGGKASAAPLLAELSLEPAPASAPAIPAAELTLPDFFTLLHERRDHAGPCSPGWALRLTWRAPAAS